MEGYGQILIDFCKYLEKNGYAPEVTSVYSAAVEYASEKERETELKIKSSDINTDTINGLVFYAITEGLPHEQDHISSSIKNVILNKLNDRIHEDCEYKYEFLTDILNEL